jgi:hypothetical protein
VSTTRLTITKEDLLKSKILEPGWYKVKITNATSKPASTDGSIVYTLEMVVTSGPKQKDGAMPAGLKLFRTYSEKAPGFAVKLFQALGAKIDPEKGAEVDFASTVGRELGAYVKNDLYKGVMKNVVEDFQP